MVDAVVTARLASYCDVFVDDGYFSAEQGKRILGRAKAAGLATKVHADELADSGGAALAADLGAASADHLLHSSTAGNDALARTTVVGGLLPAAPLVSPLPFAGGRPLIAAGGSPGPREGFQPDRPGRPPPTPQARPRPPT